MYKVSMTI